MTKGAVITIVSLLLVTGCARIPEPIGYKYSRQPKMQAAYHWDVLAYDVANRVNNELIINDYIQTPVYVKTTCGDDGVPCKTNETSTFDEAFRDLLITELVKFGVPVQQQKSEDGLTLNYKVQVVYHKQKRLRTIQPGLITAIGTGVMVLRNAPHELRTIAGAGLTDYLNTGGALSTSHEVIITTSMVASDNYLFRSSDIYFINSKDQTHYQTLSSQTSEVKLVAPGKKSVTFAAPVKAPKTAVEPKAEPETILPQPIQPIPVPEEIPQKNSSSKI